MIDTVDGIDVIACDVCGFKHVMPLPTQEELNILYKEKYYRKDKPHYLTHSEEDREWWEMTYRGYLGIVDKYCSSERKRLLEVGSGPGFFLKMGKELGWEVLGIEPSEQAAAFSERFGVSVVRGFFDAESVEGLGKFDLIFMDNLLEHVPDPASVIRLSGSLLNTGGILCVVSPNDYNPLQEVLRDDAGYEPWWVVPRHHLNYFDFASIKKLIKREGFAVKECQGTFPMEFFLLCGDNYVKSGALGRELHGKRKAFETLMTKSRPELLQEFYGWLGERGLGRSFVMVAVLEGESV